jgi:hypothetical protein
MGFWVVFAFRLFVFSSAGCVVLCALRFPVLFLWRLGVAWAVGGWLFCPCWGFVFVVGGLCAFNKVLLVSKKNLQIISVGILYKKKCGIPHLILFNKM